MNLLRNAPNAVYYCITAVLITIIGSITILSYHSGNADNIFRLVNLVWNGLALLLSGGAFLYSGSAAKSSATAETALNGEFKDRVTAIVSEALIAHDQQKESQS